MARSAMVPRHVANSKISDSAKVLWLHLAFLSSPKRPMIMLDTEKLAEKMSRSKRTISRLAKELEQAGLMVRVGYIQRHFRTYNLVWSTYADLSPEALAKGEASVDKLEKESPKKAPVPGLDLIPPALRPDTERIFRESKSNQEFMSRVSQLLEEYRRIEKENPALIASLQPAEWSFG